jgi:hypothetical protein
LGINGGLQGRNATLFLEGDSRALLARGIRSYAEHSLAIGLKSLDASTMLGQRELTAAERENNFSLS